MAFIFVPNADGSFTEGDKQTNPDTGVEYVFIEGAWRALGPDIADEFPELDNRYVKKAGDTMTGRLTAPRIAVEGTILESGRVFEAQFDGTTNAWINANGQVRSNFVVDDNAEFKTLTTKQYVDDKVGGADYLPLTGGTLTGTTRIRGASFFVNDSDGNEVIRLQESGFVRSLDMFRCQRDVDGPAFQARIGTESNAEIRTNGSAFFKGTVNMNSNKITNVTTPTSNDDAANKSYVDTKAGEYLPLSGGTLTSSLKIQRGTDKTGPQWKISPNGSTDYSTSIYSLSDGQMRFRTSHTENEGDHVGSHIVLNPNGGTPETKIYHVVEAGENSAVPKSYVDNAVASAGGGGGVPVGSIMIWMNSTAPSGWFKLQGGSFDTSTYPQLHAYLQNTSGYTSGRLPSWSGHYPGEYGGHLNGSMGEKVGQRTAQPNGGAPKSSASIPNGGTRTFNGAGGTSAYSDSTAKVTINDGWDTYTRPQTVIVHYIIKHD